mmetsp:Transcript_47779/g.111512  ORF Transcript_47779/g.111512 Transcript_47779/m.111512 type:complete len:215 (+) Transcript_47779:164-808(+)
MSRPPKMRSCIFLCCGWHTKAFVCRVSLMRTVFGSESAGISTEGWTCATSFATASASTASGFFSKGVPTKKTVTRERAMRSRSTFAAMRWKRARSASVRSSSGLTGAERRVAGSRATNVKSASSQGSCPPCTPSEKASRRSTIELRPTHATEPSSFMLLRVSACCNSWMRSTDAVTSMSFEGARGRLCLAETVPASASRSSSTRPIRTLPYGLR